MPFTATHVAAVVPVAWLCRWRLPLSALAIGSMVPDLPGFYPSLIDYPSTHTFVGVVTHCVPLGVIGFYLFHLLLKQPLIDLLPTKMMAKLSDWAKSEIEVRPLRILVVVCCVAIGAFTHVLWDSFTHSKGLGVSIFPQLKERAFDFRGQPIRGYTALQHGSSLLLLPPLAIGFFLWVIQQPATQRENRTRAMMPHLVSWSVIALLALGGLVYFYSLIEHPTPSSWMRALRASVKHVGALSMFLLLVYSIGMQITWWLQSDGADGEKSGPRMRWLAKGSHRR